MAAMIYLHICNTCTGSQHTNLTHHSCANILFILRPTGEGISYTERSIVSNITTKPFSSSITQ